MNVDSTLKSEEFQSFCHASGMKFLSGLQYLHTATKVCKKSIESLKGFILANLEGGHNLEEKM